jgi:hypothetical protein
MRNARGTLIDSADSAHVSRVSFSLCVRGAFEDTGGQRGGCQGNRRGTLLDRADIKTVHQEVPPACR